MTMQINGKAPGKAPTKPPAPKPAPDPVDFDAIEDAARSKAQRESDAADAARDALAAAREAAEGAALAEILSRAASHAPVRRVCEAAGIPVGTVAPDGARIVIRQLMRDSESRDAAECHAARRAAARTLAGLIRALARGADRSAVLAAISDAGGGVSVDAADHVAARAAAIALRESTKAISAAERRSVSPIDRPAYDRARAIPSQIRAAARFWSEGRDHAAHAVIGRVEATLTLADAADDATVRALARAGRDLLAEARATGKIPSPR